jgi:hypothetical protein
MISFVVFVSLLSLCIAFSSILIATRTIGKLEEKYTLFAETHIKHLRNEMSASSKEVGRQIGNLAGRFESNGKFNDLINKEAKDLKKDVASARARLVDLEERLRTMFPKNWKRTEARRAGATKTPAAVPVGHVA